MRHTGCQLNHSSVNQARLFRCQPDPPKVVEEDSEPSSWERRGWGRGSLSPRAQRASYSTPETLRRIPPFRRCRDTERGPGTAKLKRRSEQKIASPSTSRPRGVSRR